MKSKKENLLEFEAVERINETIAYGSCSICNGLFEIELSTGACKYLSLFPDEKIDADRLHAKSVKVRNKIYFIPSAANHIAVVNLETDEIENVELEAVDKDVYEFYKPRFKFSDGILFKDMLILIPSTYPAIIKLNPRNNEIKYEKSWIPNKGFFFRKGTYIFENRFYIPSILDNFVLEYDMQNGRGRQHFIGEKNYGSWSICGEEDNMWLIPKCSGAVTYWNPLNGDVKSYDRYPSGFQGNNFLFTKGYIDGEKLILVPAYANMPVSLSCKTGEMKQIEIFDVGEHTEVGFMFVLDNRYYLRIINKNKSIDTEYVYIDIKDNRIGRYKFFFKDGKNVFFNEYGNEISMHLSAKELSLFGLNEFINYIKNRDGAIDEKQLIHNKSNLYQELLACL